MAAIAALALAATVLGVPAGWVGGASAAGVVLLAMVMAFDYVSSRRRWFAAAPTLTRRLPSAFAVGIEQPVQWTVAASGVQRWRWRCRLYDEFDPTLQVRGQPADFELQPQHVTHGQYGATATHRGEIVFHPAQLRVRSILGLVDLRLTLGARETRRVYPDFAQIARYQWLLGSRRLQEIGIKTFQRRGEGTDFKQLSEYHYGDPVRRIDWKASQRFGKPVVREFQEDRDQNVVLLLDSGRRMRAEDSDHDGGRGSHFDHVLNAALLLSYVALEHGDAVGALTFGTAWGSERWIAPHKGRHFLQTLMARLYDLEPTLEHSDYVTAATQLMQHQHKRALVILITNFRGEDSREVQQALRLLRTRHLVLVASLRETVLRELQNQPLRTAATAIEVASAHLQAQSRTDAFNRLAARDATMLDAEPQQLAAALVNRYRAVKRAGLI